MLTMNTLVVLRLLTLCILAIAVAADNSNAANVLLVKKEVTHPLEFCDFYLSAKQTRSPLPELGVAALQKACESIKALLPSKPISVHSPLLSSKQCPQWNELLSGEYKHSIEFCHFYLSYPRSRSPVPGLSVLNLLAGCRCVIAFTPGASAKKAQQTSTARSIATTRPSSSIAKPITLTALVRLPPLPKGKDALPSPRSSSTKAATAVRFASAILSSASTTTLSTSSIFILSSLETTSPITSTSILRHIPSSQITSPRDSGFGTSSSTSVSPTKQMQGSTTAIRGKSPMGDILSVLPTTASSEPIATKPESSLLASTPPTDTIPPRKTLDVSADGTTIQPHGTTYRSITVIRGQRIGTTATSTTSPATIASVPPVISEINSAVHSKTSWRWASNRGKLPISILQTHSPEVTSASPRPSSKSSEVSTTLERSSPSRPVDSYSASSLVNATPSSAELGSTSTSPPSRSLSQLTSSVTTLKSVSLVTAPSKLVSSKLKTTTASRSSPALSSTTSLQGLEQIPSTTRVSMTDPGIGYTVSTTFDNSHNPFSPTSRSLLGTDTLTFSSSINPSAMPASTTYVLRASVLPSLESSTPIAQSVEPSAEYPEAEYPTYSIGGGYPQWVPSRASNSPGDQLLSSNIVSLRTDAETTSKSSSPDLDSPQTSMVVTTLATDGVILTVPSSATFMSTANAPNAAPSRWTSSESFETIMSFTVSDDVETTTDAVAASSLLPTQGEDIRRTVVMSSSTTRNLEEPAEALTSSAASSEDNVIAGTIGFEDITSTISTNSTQYGSVNGSGMRDTLTVWHLTSSPAHSTASKNIETVGASNSTGWNTIRPFIHSVSSTQIVISSETTIPQGSNTNEARSDSSTWSESSNRDYWSVTSNDLVDTTTTRDGMDPRSTGLAMETFSSSTDEFSTSTIFSVTTVGKSNFTTQATNAPNASLTMSRSEAELLATMASPDFAPSSRQNVSKAGTPVYSTWSGPSSYIESPAIATALNSSGSLTMSATRVSQPEPVSSATSSTSEILLSTITESDLSSVSLDEASVEVSPLTYYKPADVLASPTSSSDAVIPMTDASFTASSTLAAGSVTTGSSTDSISSDQSSILPSRTTSSSFDDVSLSTDAPDKAGSMSLTPQLTSAADLSSTEESRTRPSKSSASNEPSSWPDSSAEVTDVFSTSPTTSEPASDSTENSTVYSNDAYSAIRTGNYFADFSTEEAGPSSSKAEISSTGPTNRVSLQISASSTAGSTTSSFVLSDSTSTSVEKETGSVSSTASPNRSSYDPSTPSDTRNEPPTTTFDPIAPSGDVAITSSSEDHVLSSSTSPTASGRYHLTGNMQNSSSSEPFRSDSSSKSYVDASLSSTSDLSSTYYATTTSSDSLNQASSSASATESVYWPSASATTPVTESSTYTSSYSLGVCQTGAASDLSSYPSASQFCSSFMAPPLVTSTTTIYSTQTTATTSFTTSTQTVQTDTSQRVVTRYYSDSTVTTTTCVPASNSGNNFRKRDAPVTFATRNTLLQRRADAGASPSVSTECSGMPSVLSRYSCDEVSSACSCNGISTISQTPTSTVTVISSVQQTDVIVQTTTESITVTILSSSTSYIPQTSTVLYCPRPSSDCGNKGYSFAYYGNEPYGNSVANMDATYTKKMTPNYNSTTNLGVGLYGSEWASVSLYGSSQTYSDNYFYLAHKGYFYAQVTGNYNFTIKDADDVAYVWMGEAAYTGWTGGPDGGNYVAKARCCWPPENTNTTTYYMEAETYVPFRIVLGQQDGGTSLGLTITAPDGTVILETGKESDYVVQYSCDGTAPPFPDWGYET